MCYKTHMPPKTRRALADFIFEFPSQTTDSERLEVVEQLQEKLVAHGLDNHFAIRNHANSSKLYLKAKGTVSKATALNKLSKRLGTSINEAQLYDILRTDISNVPIVKMLNVYTKDLESELADAEDQYNAFESHEETSVSSPIALSATSPIWTPGARTVPNYTRTDPTDTIRRWEHMMKISQAFLSEPGGVTSPRLISQAFLSEPGGVTSPRLISQALLSEPGDDEYDYDSSYSSDSDDSDSKDSDDMISDDSDDDAHSDFTLDDDSDDSDDDTQSSAKNRVVDNAEMRTLAGEPETTQQRDLAIQVAKAIAGTSSFTKKDTEYKNGKPKPLSELMRMARVTSLWPVLSEFQKDQYMQTTGVLANDRHYIARNVQFGVPIRKKRPFVQNAQGKIIYV